MAKLIYEAPDNTPHSCRKEIHELEKARWVETNHKMFEGTKVQCSCETIYILVKNVQRTGAISSVWVWSDMFWKLCSGGAA